MPEEKSPPITDPEKKKVDPTLTQIGEGEELLTEEPAVSDEPPITEKVAEEIPEELKAIMVKKGWKNLDEVTTALESHEKKITELSKDVRIQSMSPAFAPERPRDPKPEITYPKLPDDPANMTKEELDAHMAKEREATKTEMAYEYDQVEKSKEYKRYYAEMYNLAKENPGEFERLRPTMTQLSYQHPHASLVQLRDEARRVSEEREGRDADRMFERKFGKDVDPDKLKVLLAKARPAPLSISPGGGQGTLTEDEKKKADAEALKRIKEADMYEG
ncbi:hypothetical protein KA005_66065 [bacterium]|nr:hypothetical protein [bacterium]